MHWLCNAFSRLTWAILHNGSQLWWQHLGLVGVTCHMISSQILNFQVHGNWWSAWWIPVSHCTALGGFVARLSVELFQHMVFRPPPSHFHHQSPKPIHRPWLHRILWHRCRLIRSCDAPLEAVPPPLLARQPSSWSFPISHWLGFWWGLRGQGVVIS